MFGRLVVYMFYKRLIKHYCDLSKLTQCISKSADDNTSASVALLGGVMSCQLVQKRRQFMVAQSPASLVKSHVVVRPRELQGERESKEKDMLNKDTIFITCYGPVICSSYLELLTVQN